MELARLHWGGKWWLHHGERNKKRFFGIDWRYVYKNFYVLYTYSMKVFKFFYLLLIVLLCSCVLGTENTFETSTPDWDGKTKELIYNPDENNGILVYELPKDVGTVKLTLPANAGVEVFYARLNHTDNIIPKSSTQYLVDNKRSVENDLVLSDYSEALKYSNISGYANGLIRQDFVPAREFTPPQIKQNNSRYASNSAISAPQMAVSQISGSFGETKKLYVDSSATGYSKRDATLRAVGEHCYVWVVNDYYTTATTASANKVNDATAKALADQFDMIYGYVRNIFGEEAECIAHYSGGEVLLPIENVSNTGSKVNIVLTDIQCDYSATQQGGTFGYFWAKDYYSQAFANYAGDYTLKLSNEGKYFYVDTYFTNIAPDTVYSTLAHEFQHMIHFGVKFLTPLSQGREGKSSSTWFNEMLSMLCEDMMQSKLGISDENSPLFRLPWFCANYIFSGITDWLDGDYVNISYATAYTFGAYLARNYGGPDLIKKIAQCSEVDKNAITYALGQAGKNETFKSVFTKYPRALTLSKDPEITFNRTVKSSTAYDGYYYPMKAFNIFEVAVPLDAGTLYGPGLLSYNVQYELRPNGFSLHRVAWLTPDEVGTGGTMSLPFSSYVADGTSVLLLVQPYDE